MKADQVLLKLINLFSLYLEELSTLPERSSFVLGEMSAFIECLEIISEWESPITHDLNCTLAQKFGV